MSEIKQVLARLNVVDAVVAGLVLAVAAVTLRGLVDSPATVDRDLLVTLRVEDVPPFVAERLRPGDVERFRGDVVARVEEVRRSPAQVAVPSSDGRLRLADHPRLQDLTLDVRLRSREEGGDVYYRTSRLKVGTSLTLEPGDVRVEGVVTALRRPD